MDQPKNSGPHGAPTSAPGRAQDELARLRRQHAELLLALRERASKATPGPWVAVDWNGRAATTIKCTDSDLVIAETTGFGRHSMECAVEAAFIATANPAAVLSLLNYIAVMEDQVRHVRAVTLEAAAAAIEHDGDWCGGHGMPSAPTPSQCANKIRAMIATATQSAPVSAPEAWLPMETAPKDCTMLRLLVNFTDNATDDGEGPFPTIGANNFQHDGIDEWRIAGWCWSHDHFTEGRGTPVGWLPMIDKTPAANAGGLSGGKPADWIETKGRRSNRGGRYWHVKEKDDRTHDCIVDSFFTEEEAKQFCAAHPDHEYFKWVD